MSEPLRVMIIHAPTGIGGTEGVILNINRFIDESRVRLFNCPFINFTRGDSLYLRELESRGILYKATPLIRRFEYRYVRATRNLIHKYRIQLIHSHGYRADVTALLAARGQVPVVSTIHGFTGNSIRVKIYEMLQRLVIDRMSVIMPVSQKIEHQLLSLGIPSKRLHRLSNIIDEESLSQLKPANMFNGKDSDSILKITFVGRLSPEKGLDVLLSAIESLKMKGLPFKLLIIGDGPLRREHEETVRIMGLSEQVNFLGFRSDAKAIIAAADVFVLPSWTEGLPLVILEAMALSKPVVASCVGGVPQLIKSKETGLLFNPGDIYALAKMLEWIYFNKENAQVMGKKAQLFIKDNFNPKAWAEELTNIYYQAAGYDSSKEEN